MLMFYSDLFEFFQAAARVFQTEKEVGFGINLSQPIVANQVSKLKRTPEVIGNLLWRPFDVRFQSIRNRLAFHQALVKEELHWATMGQLRSTMQGVAERVESHGEDIRLAKLAHRVWKSSSNSIK